MASVAMKVLGALMLTLASAEIMTPGGTDEITFPVGIWKMDGAKYTISRLNQVGTNPLQLSGGKHWDHDTKMDQFMLPAGCYMVETITVADPGMAPDAFSWNITGTTITGQVYDEAYFAVGGAFCDLSGKEYSCLAKRVTDALTCRNYPEVLLAGCHLKVTDTRYTTIKAECAKGYVATPSYDLSISLVFDTLTDSAALRAALLKQLAIFFYMGDDTSALKIESVGPVDPSKDDSPYRVVVSVAADSEGNYDNYLRRITEDGVDLTTLLYGTDGAGNLNVPQLEDTTLLGAGSVEAGTVPIDPATQKLLDAIANKEKTEQEVIDEINKGIKDANGDADDDAAPGDDDAEGDDKTGSKGGSDSGSSSSGGGLSTIAIASIAAGAGLLMLGAGFVAYRRRSKPAPRRAGSKA